MSVRSFQPVFMASIVAGAALSCYLVSLRVASERAELEKVETQIVLAQRDIRLLQTEIGTRGRLAQLERWNVKVLALSAPSADQILGDKFQLARLVSPERQRAIEAPVVLASAPAAQDRQPLGPADAGAASAAPAQLLHEAGVRIAESSPVVPKAVRSEAVAKPATATAKSVSPAKVTASKDAGAGDLKPTKKAGDNSKKAAPGPMTEPVRTANIDPLAPLPADRSIAKASRTNR